MEKENKSLIISVLLGVSLLTALWLESRISASISAQLTLIFLGIIVSGAVLFGLMMHRQWAYPLGALLFVLSIANVLWLFALTRSVLGLAFSILINVIGLVFCIVCVEREYSGASLETYELGGESLRSAPRKRGRPPKNAVYSNF